MLVETAIDAGNPHALIEVVRVERNAWKAEAKRFIQCAAYLNIRIHDPGGGLLLPVALEAFVAGAVPLKPNALTDLA